VRLARQETPEQRRRRVRRCLDLTRQHLAASDWQHTTREPSPYPSRDVLIEELRVVRAEVQRQEAVIDVQQKIIEELKSVLGEEME